MKTRKIEDICTLNPKIKNDLPLESLISFVPMSAVSTDGNIDLTDTLIPSESKGYTLFQDGDILFAKITPCMENGKGAIAHGLLNGYGAGSTEFIVLRPNTDCVTAKWLYLYLSQRSFRWKCQQHMTGSAGQKRVPAKYLASCEIPIPIISEQERIVSKIEELFSKLDASVAELQTAKEKLKVYRQAVYSSVYYKMRDLRPITDFFDITGGLTKNSKRNELPFQMPYLRVANVYYDYLDLSEIKEIGVTEQEIDRCLLQKGDLLFVEGNGSKAQIGRVAIWNGQISKCLHQNHIVKGRPLGNMLSEYALYYLISNEGRKQIVNVAKSTSGLYTLSTNKIKGLKVPYCDLNDQKRLLDDIKEKLSVYDGIEQTVNTSLQQAEALRQSILKQAFEGK